MPKYKEQPASDKILNTLEDKIFNKSFRNISSTVMAFPGAGKTAEIRYLIRNIELLKNFDRKHVFGYLDLETLADNQEIAFRECITFISTFFGEHLPKEVSLRIKEVLSKESIDPGDVADFLHFITVKHNTGITFILDNFQRTYEPLTNGTELVEIVHMVRKINPMKISFIFLSSREFDDNAIEKMGKLGELFLQNILWSGDVLFDEDSAGYFYKNMEKRTGYTFDAGFKEKTTVLCKGDPSSLKLIATMAVDNKNFEADIAKENNIKELYPLLSTEVLDMRFRKIVNSLLPTSLRSLESSYENPTKFLTETGLVNDSGTAQATPLNVLFDHFVKSNGKLLENVRGDISHNGNVPGETLLKEVLSGKELMVFNLLSSKTDTIVTKDEIAETVWGSDWENMYSDWAIDQLISRLRGKLKNNNYPKTLKTVKGQGIILT